MDQAPCGRTLVVIHLPIDTVAFTSILTAVADVYPSAVVQAPDRDCVVVVVNEDA